MRSTFGGGRVLSKITVVSSENYNGVKLWGFVKPLSVLFYFVPQDFLKIKLARLGFVIDLILKLEILFRGEIAASVGRAFLSVKLRQRIKSSPTRPEILGNTGLS